MKIKAHKLFAMGTHIPVLKALIECFEPTGILELGIGENSTRLLYEYGKRLISIENDREWYLYFKNEAPPKDHFELIYHDLGTGIHRKSKFIKHISKELANNCVKFYNSILDKYPEINFLFIDHVSGLRAFTLVEMFNKFDFIVYHDAHSGGYYYNTIDGKDTSKYLHFMFKSFDVWSGILIHKKHQDFIDNFDLLLKKYGAEYSSTTPYKHLFEKIN